MTWRIGGCPRCSGDMFLDKDVNNVWVETCLQCGFESILKQFDADIIGSQSLQKVRTSVKYQVIIGASRKIRL